MRRFLHITSSGSLTQGPKSSRNPPTAHWLAPQSSPGDLKQVGRPDRILRSLRDHVADRLLSRQGDRIQSSGPCGTRRRGRLSCRRQSSPVENPAQMVRMNPQAGEDLEDRGDPGIRPPIIQISVNPCPRRKKLANHGQMVLFHLWGLAQPSPTPGVVPAALKGALPPRNGDLRDSQHASDICLGMSLLQEAHPFPSTRLQLSKIPPRGLSLRKEFLVQAHNLVIISSRYLLPSNNFRTRIRYPLENCRRFKGVQNSDYGKPLLTVTGICSKNLSKISRKKIPHFPRVLPLGFLIAVDRFRLVDVVTIPQP